jgi:hypothetical protein
MSSATKIGSLLRVLAPLLAFVGICGAILFGTMVWDRLDNVEATSQELLVAYRQEVAHRVTSAFDQATRSQSAKAKELATQVHNQLDEGDKLLLASDIRAAMSTYRSISYTVS